MALGCVCRYALLVLQSARRGPQWLTVVFIAAPVLIDSIEASSWRPLRAGEWEGKDAMASVCCWWLFLELCLGCLSLPMQRMVANTTGQGAAVSRQVSPPSASVPQPAPMKMFL